MHNPLPNYLMRYWPHFCRALPETTVLQDAVLIYGPQGSCKTSMAVHVATSLSRYHRAEYLRGRGLGLVFHFTYGESYRNIFVRTLSCAARIPRETLDKGEQAILTTGTGLRSLKAYERAWYKGKLKKGQIYTGEMERFAAAEDRLRLNHYLVAPRERGCPRGLGALEHIQRLVDEVLQERAKTYRDSYVAAIVIDSVGRAVEPYADTSAAYTRALNGFAEAARDYAASLRCSIWLTQNARWDLIRPGKLPKRTATEGSKKLVSLADEAFAIGGVDSAGHAIFGPVTDSLADPTVIRVEGEFSRVRDVGRWYEVDRVSGCIVRLEPCPYARGSEEEVWADGRQSFSH